MSVSTPISPDPTFPTPTSPTPTPSARDELDELIHGPCDPDFRAALHRALAAEPAPVRPDPDDRARHIARQMRRLGEAAPGTRQMFAEPARLAEFHAWVAVAEPALCMVAITHHLLCLGSMVHLAPDHAPLKAQFEALESGRTVGAYLITEVGRSNSHLSVRTRAEYDPRARAFVLHTPDPEAAKFSEVSAANGVVHTAVVLARLFVAGTDRGVFPFVVDLTDQDGPLPGIHMSAPLELSAVPLDYAQIRFQQLRLPYERWLRDSADISEDGVFHDPLGSTDRRMQRTLCVGQGLWATLPAVAAAVCRQSAVLALRYARQRTTQGRLAPGTTLLQYRTQQHAVFGALADAFVLTCVAHRARALWQQSLAEQEAAADEADGAMTFSPWAAVSRPLAAYKALAVRTAARVTADCQLHCGFSGHLDANRLAGYHGFHHAFEAAGGDSQLIFYDLGTALSGGDGPDRPDAPPTRPKGETGWWGSVAAAHEQRLARDLRRATGSGAGKQSGTGEQPGTENQRTDFETWNPQLGLAGELGEIHALRLAAEDVARVVARIRDPGLRALAERLARLSGLLAARRWSGPLLTAGTLAPDDFQGLTRRIDQLCDELMPDVPLLEEAFAYPDEIVRAPLGASDYNQALADSVGWHHGGDA
ncbi:hypothetical protein KGQ20_22055 [Catenulispora sp. NF23]|uniref:acyl-CoA dehydrogenase family protein n=1 Tax=Catenulispora pinistramenti TaxID=2705254 RepID=UPI001BAB27C4|nr:acyl-CoA dehydrogenase [Catenulispora pinistramenti]MBS2535451.1 hypothetical protein [Catenulispora pinistramenti]